MIDLTKNQNGGEYTTNRPGAHPGGMGTADENATVGKKDQESAAENGGAFGPHHALLQNGGTGSPHGLVRKRTSAVPVAEPAAWGEEPTWRVEQGEALRYPCTAEENGKDHSLQAVFAQAAALKQCQRVAAEAERLYRKEIARLTAESSERARELDRTRADLHAHAHALQHTQRELATVRAGIGFRFFHRIQSRLRCLLPPDSRRGRLFDYGRRGIALWLDQGTRAVVGKIFTKMVSPLSRRLFRSGAAAPAPSPVAPVEIYISCDQPALGSSPVLFGTINISGWALSPVGLRGVDILLDGQHLGSASYGRLRADVATAYPHIPEGERSGFAFMWDSARVPDGPHELCLRAVAGDGHCRMVGGRVVIDNSTFRKSEYEQWIDLFEPRELAEAVTHADTLAYCPLISVVMPVYNVDRCVLQRTLESVFEQAYGNWELCACDDGSTDPEVRATLAEAAQHEPRLKVVFAETNGGISKASNQALALATGEFIALLDADDELAPHALYQVAKLLNSHPDADVIYSDEDKMDLAGRRYDPFFKPHWSPDLLRSCNYLCHLTVLRASLVEELGGFRPAFDGSQDYDLFLRAIERTRGIYHIPKILYHWRAVPTSTASAAQVRMTAHAAARVALEEHLNRQGIAAEVCEGCSLGRWRVKYNVQGNPAVSIIIPTGGNLGLLEQCVRTVADKSSYRNFEFVIIDNSSGNAVQGFLPKINKLWARTRYLNCRHKPFNFSALNNQAVKLTRTPLLLFLNDDTQPINSDWLEAMVEHAQRPEVGAVGAKLLYPDNTIQHAGVVMGLSANCDHVFRYAPGDDTQRGHFDLPNVVRNVSVVTGACLMTRRDVFCEVGGFDELHLPVAFQDVDLCLKMCKRGYLIVCTPHAKLYHYEAKTKAEKIPNPYETRYMQKHWAHVIAEDPYYNSNLTRVRSDYSLAL